MLGDEVCIGQLRLKGNLFLAPVAGWSDCVFRYICESFGAAFTYTEMVSAEAVVRGNLKTATLAKKLDESRSPYAVQLFGSDKDVMAKAAAIIFEQTSCDVIDINCGCPVPKIMKTGAGSALMADLPKLGAIIAAMKKAVPVPITLKIRLGLDSAHENFLDAAKVAIDNGASAITLHARTTKQGYSGKADWEKLAKLVDFVHAYKGSEEGSIKESETFLYNSDYNSSIDNGKNNTGISSDNKNCGGKKESKTFHYSSDNSDINSDGNSGGSGDSGAGKNRFSKTFHYSSDNSNNNCDGERAGKTFHYNGYNGDIGNDNGVGNDSNIGNGKNSAGASSDNNSRDGKKESETFLYNSDIANCDGGNNISDNSDNKNCDGKKESKTFLYNSDNHNSNNRDNCSIDKSGEAGAPSRVKVFGSGDIFSRADAVRMISMSGVDGVMVARGAMGNPFIFCEDEGAGLSLSERLEVALKELRLLSREIGERGAVLEMRKRVASYIKGVSGGSAVRAKVVQAASIADYERILGEGLLGK